MNREIHAQLGPERCTALAERLGGAQALADAIQTAADAARRRSMSERQRIVFATIDVLRQAGVRPGGADIEAWFEASRPAAKKSARHRK